MEYIRKQAVENVFGHLNLGDFMPAVWGGQDGRGFDYLYPGNTRRFKNFLLNTKFKGEVKPAPDFKANDIDPEDYTACVQFNYGKDGKSWVQILLWE